MATIKPLPLLTEAGEIRQPPTWAGHVLIPLAQNVLGGVAVAGLLAIGGAVLGGVAVTQTTLAWCGVAGLALTCAITIVRFFGDDWGILARAYRAGQESMQARINELEGQLYAAEDALQVAGAGDGDIVSVQSRRLERMGRAAKHAERLLTMHFNGDGLQREKAAKVGIGDKDWRRARNLLIASGVFDGDRGMMTDSLSAALRAVRSFAKAQIEQAQNNRTWHPSWLGTRD